MKSIVINTTIRVGTRDLDSTATYEAEGLLDLNTDLPAGVAAAVAVPDGAAGEVATKTDANTATVTLVGGHGLVNGTFDVYWAGGARYAVPGTIAENTLSLDGGAGDDFPLVGTAIVVAKQVLIVAALTGDLAVALVGHCTRRAHLDFQSAASASLLPLSLAAGEAWSWADDLGFTNPLAAVVVSKILASCGESAGSGNLSIPILYDAVS